MQDTEPDINQRIAARVRELRASQKLSLDALEQKCGVSRSMISLIERGESSPTAVVLEKLAVGLGTTLTALFDEVATPKKVKVEPVSRRDEQDAWKDPASGYVRRKVSPPGVQQPMQIVEIRFPPGKRVAFDTGGGEGLVHQQIWMLEGTMEITVGKERYRLNKGDCLAKTLGPPTMYYNPTRKTARYVAVVVTGVPAKR